MSECSEPFKECQKARSARIEAVLIERTPWDTHADLAERAGVTQQAITKRLSVTKDNALLNVTEGYDPAVKTERVQAFVDLWKQMTVAEHDHVMRLIIQSKEGKRL